MIGTFTTSPERPLRVNVAFKRVEAYADGCEGPEGQERLRAAYSLSPDAPLAADLGAGFGGWVDVVYLDDDLRLVKGNRGNVYVLSKVAADGVTAVSEAPVASRIAPHILVEAERFRRHYVDIDDGAIHYREAGPADGPPVVLLHQSPEDSTQWTEARGGGGEGGRGGVLGCVGGCH